MLIIQVSVMIMIMFLALLLPMFYFSGKLLQVFRQKYPELYDAYKKDLSGARRNPYSILMDKRVDGLNDMEVKGIFRILKFFVVLQVVVVFVVFYVIVKQVIVVSL